MEKMLTERNQLPATEAQPLSEEGAELAAERERPACQQKELAKQAAELNAERNRVAAAQAELAAAREELEAMRSQLTGEREKKESHNAPGEPAFSARLLAEHSQRVEEGTEARDMFESSSTSSGGKEGDSSETEDAALKSRPQQSDNLEVLERLRNMMNDLEDSAASDADLEERLTKEEEHGQESQKEELFTSEEAFREKSVGQPAQVQHGQDDEESLEDYMARLMERVRGSSPRTAVIEPEPLSLYDDVTPESDQQMAEDDDEPEEPPPPRNPHQDTPRRTAPERRSDLVAMRELANLSAQSAIDSHMVERWKTAALGKAMVSVFALAVAAGLFVLSPFAGTAPFYGAMIGLVVAVFWILQAGMLLGHVRNVRGVRDDRPGSQSNDPDPGGDERKGNSQQSSE